MLRIIEWNKRSHFSTIGTISCHKLYSVYTKKFATSSKVEKSGVQKLFFSRPFKALLIVFLSVISLMYSLILLLDIHITIRRESQILGHLQGVTFVISIEQIDFSVYCFHSACNFSCLFIAFFLKS